VSAAKTRDCFRCGASFYDDGNTWCPRCDATYTPGPGTHPDAAARIAAARKWTQDNLAAGRPERDPTGKPEFLS
jgi:uncharacterized Zn finger protein (UPF0148 family)